MDAFSIVNGAVVIIGIPTMVGVLISIGRKLQTLDTLDKDVDDIKKDLKDHDRDIIRLKSLTLGETHSPIRPNDKGMEILQSIGWGSIYGKIRNDIILKIDEAKPKTLYDVENTAVTVMWDMRDMEEMNPFKIYTVNHPDLSLKLLFTIASWLIRDDYAKERSIKE